MRRTLLAFLLLAPALHAAPRQISLEIEPSQPIRAIVLRHGSDVRSLEVRDGRVVVPEDLPLPWTLGLARFEPVVYAAADLEQKKPLLLRELGTLRGVLQRSAQKTERVILLLHRTGGDVVDEIDTPVAAEGTFEVRLAAGIYDAAVLAASAASRIRSGIVIRPGAATDAGAIVCEPASKISFRVLDARTEMPLAGAKVTWDPPNVALNASTARRLYAKRWSGVSDRRGVVTLPTVGPMPIAMRWRAEAKGYAGVRTKAVVLAPGTRVDVPDARLDPEAFLTVRVRIEDGRSEVRNAKLVVGEPSDANPKMYDDVEDEPLAAGETRFRLRGYGAKRVSIRTANGNTLLYRDVTIDAGSGALELELEEIEIHGKVVQQDRGLAGALVTLADPSRAQTILARATTDENGRYRLRTYQSGDLFLYAIVDARPGVEFGGISKHLETDGSSDYTLDFDLLNQGAALAVVDAETGVPCKARVAIRVIRPGSNETVSMTETDSRGRLALVGYGEGTAQFDITCRGHRARHVEVPLGESPQDTLVRVERTDPIRGRVVDRRGVPVPRAIVSGGYGSEWDVNPRLQTSTDADGRFRLDSALDPGTPFYVVAAGHALGITTLDPAGENTVVLHPPGSGAVTLLPDDAPPSRIYLVIAAPVGGAIVPAGPMSDLAEANGLTPYQLQGSAKDGTLVLPEFLPPGRFELTVCLRGGKPYRYQSIGTVMTPLARTIPIAWKTGAVTSP